MTNFIEMKENNLSTGLLNPNRAFGKSEAKKKLTLRMVYDVFKRSCYSERRNADCDFPRGRENEHLEAIESFWVTPQLPNSLVVLAIGAESDAFTSTILAHLQ